MSRDLLCLIVNRIKMRVNPHSRQIHARNNNRIKKNTIFNIFRVASRNPIQVFSSFLDLAITGHVTQLSGFLLHRKITDFSEVVDFERIW